MAIRRTSTDDEDVEETVDELNELIQLDLDAVKAYDHAIDKVEDDDARDDLQMFRLDHERHADELGRVVRRMGGTPKTRGDLKGVLLEGMTALRSALGTVAALRAMRTAEKLTNRTYARALDKPLTAEAREVVLANRDDERRHLFGIKAHLARLDEDFEEDLEDEDELQVLGDDGRPTAY